MTSITETRRIEIVKKKNNNFNVQPFPFALENCKRAFTTRNVPDEAMKSLVSGHIKPKAGDLVLCEVKRLRQHCRIELPNGRRSRMFVNDKIIVCYGNRYAPDQFESIVPENLDECHLVAGGGIASLMRFKSPKVKPATQIIPLGLIANAEGCILNLKDFSVLKHVNASKKDIPIIVVAGSSMNAGKTTTVASIIRGLCGDGFNVAAAKITGTGSGGDLWHFVDSGVKKAIDFTDAGYATTYKMPMSRLHKTVDKMVNHLSTEFTDVIVIEVADGILQQETKALLESKQMKSLTSAMFYTSGDSTSALYGVNWLNQQGYDVMAVSGVVSSNPLGKLEVENNCTVPVLKKNELVEAGFGYSLMDKISGIKEQLLTK